MKTEKPSGDGIRAKAAGWRFDGDVSEQFERHIRRSVPLYDEGHNLICKLSDFFVKEGSQVYEIGASTGLLSYRLATHHAFRKNTRFTGIEIEEEMVHKATRTYRSENLTFLQEDVNTFAFEKADLIVSYYTIQFIRPSLRQQLIDRIYEALNWGGAFIMFEKVRGPDARFQDIFTSIYTDYKLEQGYSAEEIVNKAQSLKGVLEPFSTQGNLDLLARAGFVDVTTVMKHIPFEGFLAIK
ncbi:MAG: methyltransferase [Campylobacteraceae bacterium 4484_4]|nr:MAG: methyltransferase [Campylobacteraceae bacterium 4484_4]